MAETKEIKVSYSNDFESFFCDIVKIEANPETVSLIFGIKSNDSLTAEASHRAIMTIPHFLRLAEVCGNTAKEIINHIEKEKKKHK